MSKSIDEQRCRCTAGEQGGPWLKDAWRRKRFGFTAMILEKLNSFAIFSRSFYSNSGASFLKSQHMAPKKDVYLTKQLEGAVRLYQCS